MPSDNERLRDIGLLIIRVGFGLGFNWFHGWPKLQGGVQGWERNGQAMRNFGITFGYEWWGAAAMLAEFVGGICIALGLFFRPAAAALAFTMFVATTNHIVTGQGSPANAMKNAFLFVGLPFIGPGRYSIDHLLASRRSAKNERERDHSSSNSSRARRDSAGD